MVFQFGHLEIFRALLFLVFETSGGLAIKYIGHPPQSDEEKSVILLKFAKPTELQINHDTTANIRWEIWRNIFIH